MADLTEGRRIYAIGDLHGRLDLLDGMLARVRADLDARPHPAPRLVFLGDYCDRGPESRGVLARLIEVEAGPLPATFLLGNHDSYIEAYLEDPEWFDRTYHWLHSAMGGAETLASYGVSGAAAGDPSATRDAFAAAFPAAHLAFLHRCALTARIGGYLFVHAGIRPGVAVKDQTRDDLIWIREPFLSSREDFGFKVVHGHTIVPAPEHRPNRIAIDTGGFRTGILTCLVLEGDEVSVLDGAGPVPLPETEPGLGGALRRGFLAAISGRKP
jgi:serine/threonine protein phosphatase 1